MITEFKYERKNEKDSGRSSNMTPSCKWPIRPVVVFHRSPALLSPLALHDFIFCQGHPTRI